MLTDDGFAAQIRPWPRRSSMEDPAQLEQLRSWHARHPDWQVTPVFGGAWQAHLVLPAGSVTITGTCLRTLMDALETRVR